MRATAEHKKHPDLMAILAGLQARPCNSSLSIVAGAAFCATREALQAYVIRCEAKSLLRQASIA